MSRTLHNFWTQCIIILLLMGIIFGVYDLWNCRCQTCATIKQQEQSGVRIDVWKKIFEDQLHPDRSDCRALFNEPKAEGAFYNAAYIEHRRYFESKAILANGGKPLAEGHAGQVRGQFRLYYWLARQPWVTNICEIGFNAGHSTMQWLAASNHVQVYSFDIGSHKYTRPMAKFLNETFPERLHLTIGNSLETIPRFVVTNPNVKCDVVVVDGGHKYEIALGDLKNMRSLANGDHHIVIFDDFPTFLSRGKYMEELGRAWNTMRANGSIVERFACTQHPQKTRGFVVGYYV